MKHIDVVNINWKCFKQVELTFKKFKLYTVAVPWTPWISKISTIQLNEFNALRLLDPLKQKLS